MSMRGHNERAYRLDGLASEILKGFSSKEKGEEFVIGAWLAIGDAMNEARALFPGDREFGQWVETNVLGQLAQQQIEPKDQQAAMWAAANADQFEEARQRGNPRTIRGIHAKWKEIEAEREAERFAEEQRKLAEARKAEAAPGGDGTDQDRPEIEAGSKPDQERTTPEPQQNKAEKPIEQAVDTTPSKPDQEPEPDPYGYGKLTGEALLDTANGLRADLDDEKTKRKAAEAEVKALKAQLRDFDASDKDEVIRRLQASVKNAENAKWKALEDRDAYHRQLHAVKKERDAAVASLQSQEVPL